MRLARFFRRVRDVRDRCGAWCAGDLAVCIDDCWIATDPHSPVVGDVLRVVEVDEIVIGSVRTRGLAFDGKPVDYFWDARGFRKPVRDDQPASADFSLPARQPEKVDA